MYRLSNVSSTLKSWHVLYYIFHCHRASVHPYIDTIIPLCWTPKRAICHRRVGPFGKACFPSLSISTTILLLKSLNLEKFREKTPKIRLFGTASASYGYFCLTLKLLKLFRAKELVQARQKPKKKLERSRQKLSRAFTVRLGKARLLEKRKWKLFQENFSSFSCWNVPFSHGFLVGETLVAGKPPFSEFSSLLPHPELKMSNVILHQQWFCVEI